MSLISNYNKIKAVLVYLELRSTREFVGRLERKDTKYCFTYSKKYLDIKKALPVGPELPLTKLYFESNQLFPSFADRIPSRENPAYPDYCAEFGIDVDENNELILLATIGRRGPSSFIFEPERNSSFTPQDLKSFRMRLGLSTRDFAECFGISQASIVRIENGKTSGNEVLRLLEIYYLFPNVATYYIKNHAKKLHHKKEEKILDKLRIDPLTVEEYTFAQEAAKKLLKIYGANKLLKDNKINRGLKTDLCSDIWQIREAKDVFFELRIALAIYETSLTEVEYSYKTNVGKTDVDFKFIDKQGVKWLVELARVRDTEMVEANIVSVEDDGIEASAYSSSRQPMSLPSNIDISPIVKKIAENQSMRAEDAERQEVLDGKKSRNAINSEITDILATQNKIIGKVWDKNRGQPVKFPLIKESSAFHVILMDIQRFNCGIVDEWDCFNIAYGSDQLPKDERFDIFRRYDENTNEPIKGVFYKEGEGCDRLRQAVHCIGFTFAKKVHSNKGKKVERDKYTNPPLTKKEREVAHMLEGHSSELDKEWAYFEQKQILQNTYKRNHIVLCPNPIILKTTEQRVNFIDKFPKLAGYSLLSFK